MKEINLGISDEEITPDTQGDQGEKDPTGKIEEIQSMLGGAADKAKAQIENNPEISPEKKESMIDMLSQKTAAVLRFAIIFSGKHPTITAAAIFAASAYLLNEVTGPNAIHTESSHWVAGNAEFGISGGFVNEHSAEEIQSANDLASSNAMATIVSGLVTMVGVAKGGWDAAKKVVSEFRDPKEA